MAAIVVERAVELQSEPAALWCIITDTERLNRAIGMGRIELLPNDDESAARYLVRTVSGGFPVEYEERHLHEVNEAIEQVLDGSARTPRLVFRMAPELPVPVETGTAVVSA